MENNRRRAEITVLSLVENSRMMQMTIRAIILINQIK